MNTVKLLWMNLLCILILGTVSCNKADSPSAEQPIEAPYIWVATHTIAELISDFGDQEIDVDTVAIVGTVISSDEEKNIVNQLYIKDETGAMVMEVAGSDLYQTYAPGTEILVKATNLKVDADAKKLTSADGSPIQLKIGEEDRFLLTGGTGTTSAEFITISSIEDDMLNKYIRFAGFQFDESAIGQTYVQDNTQTQWVVSNSTGDEVVLFFDPASTFASDLISSKAGIIQGLYTTVGNERLVKAMSLEDLSFDHARRAPFEKREFTLGDNTLPYQIMFPLGYDKTQSYPLVIFLHGAGERGNNNTSQMANGPDTFGSYEARTDYPAIVIFPQCPSDVMWSRRIKYTNDEGDLIFEFPVEEEPNYAMEMAIELVRNLISEEAVDQNRVYVTGLSMGGIGTYEFMYYAPDIAAAGSSMAGGHDPELLSSYAQGIDFRLYHGGNDGVVPARYSQGMFDKMQEIGINATYTEAASRGHEWNYVLDDPEYLAWMFSQSKD